jgi:hypothetical protein
VVTLEGGAFTAREVVKQCVGETSCPAIGSSALAGLVGSGQRYGYDLIVYAGLGRYLDGKQREEIRTDLAGRGISLSTGTVSSLCDRFLALFERLHLHRAPALRGAMHGGYPLHLDATCEDGRGGLLVTMDGWRRWVLWATRIPTEHQDHLRPAVEKTVDLFGTPLATVHDMGEGVSAAVRGLSQQGVPDFVCHYHFLAAVGRKLFDEAYTLLRSVLRHRGLRSSLRADLRQIRRYRGKQDHVGQFGKGQVRDDLAALALWLLDGSGKKDPTYPFALPHLDFAKRCQQAPTLTEKWVPRPHTEPERRAIAHVHSLVRRLERDPRVANAIEQLGERWLEFSRLRDVLRLGADELPRGERGRRQVGGSEPELVRLRLIEQSLIAYKDELLTRAATVPRGTGANGAAAIVLRYLQRYGERLFGHPVLRDEDGNVIDIVERTNNVPECHFGDDKQQLRRRVGRAHLARDLQQQPAQAALVANLRRADYVQVLCGSLENLPAAIAQVAGLQVEGTTPLSRDHRDISLQRRVSILLEGCHLREGLEPAQDAAGQPVATYPTPQTQPHDVQGLSEPELRTRCAEVFGLAGNGRSAADEAGPAKRSGAQGPSSRRACSPPNDTNTRTATPRLTPLGKLRPRMESDLKAAGYARTTCRTLLGYASNFAAFHRRSPTNLSRDHVIAYLRHIVHERNVSPITYRTTRTSLIFLYAVTLHRPAEVDELPLDPGLLDGDHQAQRAASAA